MFVYEFWWMPNLLHNFKFLHAPLSLLTRGNEQSRIATFVKYSISCASEFEDFYIFYCCLLACESASSLNNQRSRLE